MPTTLWGTKAIRLHSQLSYEPTVMTLIVYRVLGRLSSDFGESGGGLLFAELPEGHGTGGGYVEGIHPVGHGDLYGIIAGGDGAACKAVALGT